MIKVTTEQFIEVWMQAHKESRNALWVAETLGVQHQSVYYRAAALRARGVMLPKLPRHNQDDGKKFNELISKRLAS